jgi:hypothetical protein
MAPISSQNVETTALPLTEQITDLCDYCVNLTEATVKERSGISDLNLHKYICPQDSSPEVCRLCKVVTKQMSTQKQLPATERFVLKPTDWKKAYVMMGQIYNGGKRLYGPDSVNPRRICGVTIWENKYIVWADKGIYKSSPTYRSADFRI